MTGPAGCGSERRAIVFVGPSLGAGEVDVPATIELRPPASFGDVHRAVDEGAFAIGLVDGYFDRVPSAWHKEFLEALDEGIHCVGAASLGALRAVELAPFGMVGVGRVHARFASGELTDDDEVAVVHDVDSHGRTWSSESMVSIRETVARAASEGVVDDVLGRQLVRLAKALWYPDRSWTRLVTAARADGADVGRLGRFEAWLEHGHVDVKRTDALELLSWLDQVCRTGEPPPARRFTFHRTSIWEEGIAEIDAAPSDHSAIDLATPT